MPDRLISLLVPTRGRPDQLTAMWESARWNAQHEGQLELIVGLDIDDPARQVAAQLPGRVRVITKARRLLSDYWNECASIADGDTLWHGNDDVIFHRVEDEPRWDEQVRQAFEQWPDRIGCVHGRDGIHDSNMATLGFYSRAWVDALGYFVPPYFASDYNDTWLSYLADMINRRAFRPGVYTEHLHPAVGKGVMDDTHRERLTRHVQEGVDQLYRELAPQREADVAKLRAAIEAAAA